MKLPGVFPLVMKTIPLILVTLAALIFSAHAEPAPSKPETVMSKFTLKGGTLAQLAEKLRNEAGANIILKDDANDIKVPDMDLNDITADGIVNSIGLLLSEKIYISRSNNGPKGIVINISSYETIKTPSGKRICRLFKASATGKLTPEELNKMLDNISETSTIATELSAKANGIEPSKIPASATPQIEAHPGTGIIVVAGVDHAVNIVGQVITALGGEIVPLMPEIPEKPSPKPKF